MTDPVPSDVKNTSRTVLAAIAAGAFVAGYGSGHFGGATLDAPQTLRQSGAALVIHALRGERTAPGGAVSLTVYSHAVYTLVDGGLFKRDNGGRNCPAGAGVTTQFNAIEAGCITDGGFLRVVELRPTGDGGNLTEAYAGAPDGGDLGRVPCVTDLSAVAQSFALAKGVSCVEAVLDEP
jgi:hypothetical protein